MEELGVFPSPIPTVRYSTSASECETPKRHVIATPLFELVSVRISSDTFKEVDAGSKLPHVEIFGRILLIDDHGNEFTLFNRKRNKAKTVFLHDTSDGTSVVLQNFELQSPRCLPSKFWLVFYLRDRHRDIVIIDDWKFVDCTRGVTCDKTETVIFDKEQFLRPELVYVDYAIFQCALLACVGVIVENIVEDGSDVVRAEVSGTITATTEVSDMSCIKRVLFGKSQELVFGDFTKLSTFAMPAYSVLEIQANVEVSGDNIVSALKFEADHSCLPYEKEIMGGKCRIRVIVHWGHAMRYLPEYAICELRDAKRASKERSGDYFSERGDISDNNIAMSHKKRPRSGNLKKDQLIYIQPRLKKALYKQKWTISDDPVELVEIFSVSICSYDDGGHSLSLKGKIFAYDGYQKLVVMFDGDEKPDILHSHETVKLVAPRLCFKGPYFGIELDLKDGQEDREISNGHATYNFHTVGGWHNLRICSVVRGKHGFAALHYTIFSDAVQAKLKFTLEPNIPTGLEVHGSINARYSNCRYSTHYQKKYYQSTLFEKGESEAVKLVDGTIPLSKSVVAVPLNASLIVLANVHVLIRGERLATLQYEQTFDPEKPFEPKVWCDKLQGSKFHLSVSVEWS